MSGAVVDVIIAAAQSVAKVFVIGSVGYFAVHYPQESPLLPKKAVSTLARFGFNVLTISLIFSTIASAVSVDTIGDYWFIIIGAVLVLSISFLVATLLSYIIPIQNERDFIALRIAATFPNIVALPILIFPSLCEYSVVYEAFGTGDDKSDLYRQCEAKSNTMIFCYFFSWSLLFWSIGHPSLLKAAHMPSPTQATNDRTDDAQISQLELPESSPEHTGNVADTTKNQSADLTMRSNEHDNTSDEDSAGNEDAPKFALLTNLWVAVKRTFTSPPFIAMVLAATIGCLSPIRNLLFSQGGQLRFLGAAAETLGRASSPMSTMVVAASLASGTDDAEEDEGENRDGANGETSDETNPLRHGHHDVDRDTNAASNEGSLVMSDPNFGPHHLRRRSYIHQFGKSVRRKSLRTLNKVRQTPLAQRRVLLWFTLSRLILSPLFVVLTIVGLDCGAGVLDSVPDLAKLVLIVNSSVPGALIVVVILKSNPELHETASMVARVYLPTYIISIVTIAAWTAVGLIVLIPDENGDSFCARF